ncbi:MAG: DNA mismatch repair endonuclease MutL [Chloroflexi bacterium]|nr:DNA mismatch repair endonuclease MutL [Chloroflexota bacterium]
MVIRVLPPAVAAGIAAGEVIERPASVVKELVENALDAGASAVDVEVRQGGLASIRVSDDGCGIAADELGLAFERHATSKLRSLDDLAAVTSLGFRGEALASIAAAAHVRLLTRVAGAESAAFVELEGGVVLTQGTEAGAPGTSVTVEALFSTIPARLKFIRSASAETARIRSVLDHMAMAYPHVRFGLRSETRTLLQTSGNGVLRDVMAAVYGTEVAGSLIEVTGSARGVYPVHGMVGPAERSRPNRTGMSLFVNGRWVSNRTLSVAVEQAYTGLLMEGRYPIAAVLVDIPPAEVDANVHPNKREVRLVRDGDAFTSVQRAVREALLADSPVAEARGLLAPPPAIAAPIASASFALPAAVESAPLPEPAAATAVAQAPLQGSGGPLRILGQISNTYVVAEGADGMYLIDQHAAHEAVLYYRLLRQWEEGQPEVQPMLEPLPVELTPEQVEALPGAQPTLERYGVTLEPFGDATWLVRSVPLMARSISAAKLVAEVLDAHRGGDGAETHLAVAASIACHSAVRAGQPLGAQEMEALSSALLAEDIPQHCPHGRPTMLRVTTSALEREFGRS